MKINHLSNFVFLLAFLLPFSLSSQNNHIEINPSNLDLGEWPIGGWQEPVNLYLTNSGMNELIIDSNALVDPDNNFSISDLNLPYTLVPFYDSAIINLSFVGNNIPEGSYYTTYVTSCDDGASVSNANVLVNAYQPEVGDIIENPIIVNLPILQKMFQTTSHIEQTIN